MFGKIKEVLGLNSLLDSVTQYIEARLELLKIEIKESIANIIAVMALGVVVVFSASIAFIMFNFALAFVISSALDLIWAGPAIVGTVWLIIAFISVRMLKNEKLLARIRARVLLEMMKEPDTEEIPEIESSKTEDTQPLQ